MTETIIQPAIVWDFDHSDFNKFQMPKSKCQIKLKAKIPNGPIWV